MSQAHQVTVLHIRNSPSERRNMEQIRSAHEFTENELHLFFWYMGYRLCLDNFLGGGKSDLLADAEVNAFLKRHEGQN
jgi:hypothetical protein